MEHNASSEATQPFRVFTIPYPLITNHSLRTLAVYSRRATPSVMYPKMRGSPRR